MNIPGLLNDKFVCIEKAVTGQSKCRSCNKLIKKGERRMRAEGIIVLWFDKIVNRRLFFHTKCARVFAKEELKQLQKTIKCL